MSESLTQALLGKDATALRPDVSLAPPLSLARIEGRTAVAESLDAYARALGTSSSDAYFRDEQLEALIFSGTIDGHTAQVMAVVSRDEHGLIAKIDMYGRPWPFMALVRGRLEGIRPSLTDPRIGDELYVPSGPGTGYMDSPPVPPLAADVSFYSPLLTAVATGKEINERILGAASQIYGEQRFRAVLEAEGRPAIAAIFDGLVDGNTLQLIAMFGFNDSSEINEIRIFSRPWPITARFRTEMYALLKDALGPEFWQGPDPTTPLEEVVK
jgi:hypothetical protein